MSSRDREVMTAKQAAEYLQLHVKTLYRWLAEGRVPGVKLPNNRWRILNAELDASLTHRAFRNLRPSRAPCAQDFLAQCNALRQQILADRGKPFPSGYGARLIREGREERVAPYDKRCNRRKR